MPQYVLDASSWRLGCHSVTVYSWPACSMLALVLVYILNPTPYRVLPTRFHVAA